MPYFTPRQTGQIRMQQVLGQIANIAAILFFIIRYFYLQELIKKEETLHQNKLDFYNENPDRNRNASQRNVVAEKQEKRQSKGQSI